MNIVQRFLKLGLACAVLSIVTGAFGQAGSPNASVDGYTVEIRAIDDYDVTSGQSIPVDPSGFDAKIVVSHRGQALSHYGGTNLGSADSNFLGSSVIRYHIVLPDQEEVPLGMLGVFSAAGVAYTHVRIEPAVLARFEATSNPEISLVASLTPSSQSQATTYSVNSHPVRLHLNESAVRNGLSSIPYSYRKVLPLPLRTKYAAPFDVRSDEAVIEGDLPKGLANERYFLWARCRAQDSSISRFLPVMASTAGMWKADLTGLPPDTYKVLVFASPHSDSLTFASDGWRSDAFAVSPEMAVSITQPLVHFNPSILATVLAAAFLLGAAMLIFTTASHSHETNPSTDPEQASQMTIKPPTMAAKAHKMLACILLAIAVVTLFNYYEFFTTIVASALKDEAVTGQDWNLQNSGGISLLIMSYSISLGICIELGIYNLTTILREERRDKISRWLFFVVWLAVICLALMCALYFISHISAIYATRPSLPQLGRLAGMSELVIFFTAIAGLLPMEHENWARRPKAPKVDQTPSVPPVSSNV